MNKLKAKMLRQAIRQAAAKTELPTGYFLDLVIFWLGVDAYQKMRGPDDPHMEQAIKLTRRYLGDMVAGFQQVISPLTENASFARFKAPVAVASRSTPGLDQVLVQADVLAEVFTVLRSKTADLRTTFSEPRVASAAQKTANLASSDSPETILNGLATIPPGSRLQMTRSWLKEAANLAGVAPSEIEGTISDAETAKNLGDDLRGVEAKLGNLDPMSEDATDLQGQKQNLLEQIEAVAKASPNPAVVMSAAATAAAQSKVFATKVGREKGLSPDQERAMMIRGTGIIAAGAGSGKTRVLASKVIYHLDELGVPPQSIMATSFSRKSAAELRKRIEDFGGVFPKGTDTGLGTTHSIAAKLMREYGGGSVNRDGMKSYEQSNLVRLAMEQVKMKGAGAPPPTPQSLFTHVFAPESANPETEDTSGAPSPGGVGYSFAEAMNAAYQNRGKLSGFLRGFIEGFFNPGDKWYRMNRGKTRELTDPYGLTDKQLEILKDVFRYTGVQYHPSTDPVLRGGVGGKTAKRDKDKGLREKYPTFSTPLGQWFNLGMILTEDGTEKTDPISAGQFKQAITRYKGKVISPSEAWNQDPGPMAAVYAAYEYLKGPNGETEFRGKGDFDDVLIDVSKMMLSNPTALKQVQARFKVVLVDEAQDLNRAQHMMFGLIAGYVDPAKAGKIATAKKFSELSRDDGSMTADTYTFIGDDKQAIYEFRGADPETFIEMSNLVEGGAGFQTEILKTNYRSGERIVQAANRLIAHNKKQIPMVCDANPARVDQGGISRIPFEPVEGKDMSAPAAWLATTIEETIAIGEAEKGYDSFGIGLRSNAEAYTYGLELLKRGIPFRAKTNFFSDPNTKSLLYWLMLADEGIDGNVDRINEVVLNARSAPVTMLGPKFVDTLSSMATGNYLQWLQQNWQSVYGPHSKFTANVKHYLDNLLAVATLKNESLSNEQILERLLKMQGFDGSSVEDALVDKIRDDDEAMAELRAASPDGVIQEEDVKDQAFAPIAPLEGLLGARSNLSEAMKFVRTLQGANAKLATMDDPDAPGFRQPAVTLGTMHSWKGLEVDTMFVPIVGGRFPKSDATEEDLASERRLGYVALTRGENNVYVMDIPTIRMTPKGPVTQKSQFIDEMCLPTTKSKTSNWHVADGPNPLPYGMSAHDPTLMDAYLRGDDPYEVALNLNRENNQVMAAINHQGSAVIAALTEE